MSNRLKTLVSFIKAITDQTIEDVAASINYTRPHLTREMAKAGGNPGIEKILTDKYRKEMEDFFQEGEMLLNEDQEPYGKEIKIVNAEELLVHDSIIIKGMMRVILRNQAEIISYHSKAPLAVVLERVTQAVRVETSEEFDEL